MMIILNVLAKPSPPRGLTDRELKIISEELTFVSPVHEWDATRELMLKLMAFPELITTGSIDTFYNSTVNTSPGKFALAEHLFYEAFALPETTITDIQDYQTELMFWLDSLAHLSIMQAADTTSVDARIASAQDDVAQEIAIISDSLGLVYAYANNLIEDALEIVDSLNQSLPSTEDYESSLKTIRMMFLKKVFSDTLTTADYIELRSLAAQCLDTHGKSISLVGTLLPQAEEIPYQKEDIWERCEVEERSEKSKNLHVVPGHIVPNPVRDFTNVLLPEDFGAGTWKVTTLDGAVLKGDKIPGNLKSFRINFAGIPSGVYLLFCSDLAGTQFVEKIVVAR